MGTGRPELVPLASPGQFFASGTEVSDAQNLAIVLGLVTGLSVCAGPYGNTGYGYDEPVYGYGYNTPVYYGPGYPHPSQHRTVQY